MATPTARSDRDRRARRTPCSSSAFGNAVAVDYAAFVSRCSQASAVIVADRALSRLVQAPVRWMSPDEFLRSAPDIDGGHGRSDGLILFINSRLTETERR